MTAPHSSGNWHQIQAWVFDLDNTLYAPSSGLLDQVDILMTRFIADKLNLPSERASDLRRHYWQRHGATMTGLVDEHGVDPDEFLAASHRLDLSPLQPDPILGAALDALPGRRLVHTNGPRHHAERVLDALGLTVHFDQVIALEDTGYVPKPAAEAHRSAARLAGIDPARSAMIEDSPANLRHPAAMGMTTIWLDHSTNGASPSHVHHPITDLTGFLQTISAGTDCR